MIETLIKYNEIFVQNNSHGNTANKNIFDFSNFGSNLILTAPHATRSFVGKKEKLADACTGALVKYIGEQNRISNIIRTKFVPHKALISDFIAENKLQNHYFLDIHGFVAEPKYDICLGTGYFSEEGYPYLDKIMAAAKKYNLKIKINHHLYKGCIGLTGRYQKTWNEPRVIQIELQKKIRDFYNNPETVKQITRPFFYDIIQSYK